MLAWLTLFQSAPVIADGRAPTTVVLPPAPWLFQSAPVIADGRARPARSPMGLCRRSFNPRPSSLTGEPMLGARGSVEFVLFQSAPVIADGRAP